MLGLLIVIIFQIIHIRKIYKKNAWRIKTTTFVGIIIAILLISGLVVGYLLWTNPMNIQNYSPDFGGLVGGLLSGLATLIVVFFYLNSDQRRAEQKARKSAGVLREILGVIDDQISSVNKGQREKIFYPSKWLDYYYDVTFITKNEYLRIILKEINYVEKINANIDIGNYDEVKKIIKKRSRDILYSIEDWNIFEIKSNLSCIKLGLKEAEAWKNNKEILDIINEIKSKLSRKIEKRIHDHVIKNGSTNLKDIKIYLVDFIMDEVEIEQIFNHRIATEALLEICIDFKENSKLINFVWGELSLKKQTQ